MRKLLLYTGFIFVPLTACVNVAPTGTETTATTIQAQPSQQNSCRKDDFSGCCSWNEGIEDIRDLKCLNLQQSKSCEANWNISLQGRCAGHGGVDRVAIDGTVHCGDGDPSYPPIPKCNNSGN